MTDKTYFLETNLYSTETDRLIRSAQIQDRQSSEALNPTSIDAYAKEYPEVLLERMVKDGLLIQQVPQQ